MAITLLSGNLNTLGDNGRFEADVSTWAGADPLIPPLVPGGPYEPLLSRSSTYAHAGLYSARANYSGYVTDFCRAKPNIALSAAKKYIAKVQIRTAAGSNVWGSDEIILKLDIPDEPGADIIVQDELEVGDIKTGFQELTLQFTNVSGQPFIKLVEDLNGGAHSGVFLDNEYLYIDSFELYEYEEVDEEPEPEVDIEDVWFSRNPVTKSMAASSGWESEVNYRLHDDVRVEEVADSGTYTSKMTINLTPFTDGNVTFQVREAFRKVLTATPPNGATDIVRLTDRIKRFKHYTGEVTEVDEVPVSLTAGDANLVLLGGLSKYQYPEVDFFSTYLPANKKFMSWAPLVKPVDRQQDDYLNFFVYDEDINTLKLRAKVYFTDGTNSTSTLKTLVPVAFRNLYQLPAGPKNLDIALVNPAKTVNKYELWLEDQTDTIISEVRTYELDPFSHPRKRLFMFLNSLGSFEILRFTGAVEESTEVAKEEIVKFLPLTYAQADGERQATNATSRRQGSYSSGLLSGSYAAEWLDYLEDFLLSKQVYEVRGSVLVPVVVNGGVFAMRSDDVYERYIRFTAVDAYQEENYTPKSI